jgi:TPR repeat protein
MIYENGQGVEKNEVEAKRWYKLAEQNSQWGPDKTVLIKQLQKSANAFLQFSGRIYCYLINVQTRF